MIWKRVATALVLIPLVVALVLWGSTAVVSIAVGGWRTPDPLTPLGWPILATLSHARVGAAFSWPLLFEKESRAAKGQRT